MSEERWRQLLDAHPDTSTIVLRYAQRREWAKAHRVHGEVLGLSIEEFTAYGKWLRGGDSPEFENETMDEWLHERSYYFDESRDVYVIHLPSRKRPLAMPGVTWRALREAYSNWDGAPTSVNALCRKFGLARQTMMQLLKVMGTTHDSSPWSDEYTFESNDDTLIEDLLRKKEERVLVKAERKEWGRIKRDAESFRRLDLLAQRLGARFAEMPPAPVMEQIAMKETDDEYSVVISPTDFHWGKYAPEYSGDAYNRDVAKQRLWETTKYLISQLDKRGRPEVIYLALGGDGLHIDNQGRTTTRGTLQDCDGTPEELAWTWVMMCRDYVHLLRQVAPIKLFVIPGNHDYYTATLLRAAMAGWFDSVEGVEVMNTMSSRQYVVYGDNLITFLHGDTGKVKDWPAIIAGEAPELWGRTKHRFIFTGHLHTERELPTFGNVTVYRMPSLAGTDAWHHRHGYKSRKGLIAYVLSKRLGVVATEIAPVGE